MSGGINSVTLVGRLGADPETKVMPSGDAMASFSVATSEAWNDKEGKKQERTEWHRVTTWGKLAENCGKYLGKGKQVYVEGKLQTDEYEKDGIKRYSTKIVARKVEFLGDAGSKEESKPL